MIAYGDNDLVKIYEQKKYAEVEAFHLHPDFNGQNLMNDIALVKLKQKLNFTEYVQPACLPTGHRDYYDGILKVKTSFDLFLTDLISNLILKISGWGSVERIIYDQYGDQISGKYIRWLKEGNTYDLSHDQTVICRTKYNICVENKKDASADITCNGDSGKGKFY